MKLHTRFYVWTCGWTASHLWFLFGIVVWWFGVAMYATHRYEKARDSAVYWHERAITNGVYHK